MGEAKFQALMESHWGEGNAAQLEFQPKTRVRILQVFFLCKASETQKVSGGQCRKVWHQGLQHDAGCSQHPKDLVAAACVMQSRWRL